MSDHRDHEGADAAEADGLCAYCLVDSLEVLRAKVKDQSAELAALRGAMRAAQRLADWSNIGWREFEAKYGNKWTQEKMIDAVAESLASIPAPAAEPEPCECKRLRHDGECLDCGSVPMPAKPTAEPSLGSTRGIAPDFTGGEKSEDWVREQRSKPTAEAARSHTHRSCQDLGNGNKTNPCAECIAAEKPAEEIMPCGWKNSAHAFYMGGMHHWNDDWTYAERCKPAAPSVGKEDAK